MHHFVRYSTMKRLNKIAFDGNFTEETRRNEKKLKKKMHAIYLYLLKGKLQLKKTKCPEKRRVSFFGSFYCIVFSRIILHRRNTIDRLKQFSYNNLTIFLNCSINFLLRKETRIIFSIPCFYLLFIQSTRNPFFGKITKRCGKNPRRNSLLRRNVKYGESYDICCFVRESGKDQNKGEKIRSKE